MPRPRVYNTDRLPERSTGPVRRDRRFGTPGTRNGVQGRFVQLNPQPVRKVADLEPLPVNDRMWQRECYQFVYAVPEVRQVLHAKSNLIKRCRLVPQVRVPNTDEWTDTDDARVLRILRAFVDKTGSQGNLLKMAAIHAEIAGAAWLYGDPNVFLNPNGTMRHYAWSFKSTQEFLVEQKGQARIMKWGGSGSQEKAPPNGVAYRFLADPSWEYEERPLSVIFSVLPLLKEMVSAGQLIDVLLTSHTSAGVFFLPDEVSLAFGAMNESDDPGNPAKGMDEFQDELQYHTGEVERNPTSPERLNPLLVNGPALIKSGDKAWPTKELMGPIEFTRKFDEFLQPERQELIVRIARGLDIEPEILLGNAQANHWNAYLSDDRYVTQNVIPLGDRIADFVTASYLRPFLVAYGGMTADEAEWFQVGFDANEILVDQDHTANANLAHDELGITDEAWIEYLGLDAADMPDQEQQAKMAALRVLLVQPSLAPNIMPYLYPDVDFGDLFDDWTVGTSAPGGAGIPPSSKSPGVPRGANLPVKEPSNPNGIMGGTPTAIRAMIQTSADRAVKSTLVTAGHYVASQVDDETKASLDGQGAASVLSIVGEAGVRKIGSSLSDLFDGAFDGVAADVTEWLSSNAVKRGTDHFEARARAKAASVELTSQLELLAGSALSKRLLPGVDGMVVTPELVASCLAAGDLLDMTPAAAR